MSSSNPKYHRRSIRLPEYDYSQEGAYYVTMCTQERKYVFGEISDGKMDLNKYGKIVDQFWQDIVERYDGIVLDTFVIMPNHVHAIIIIIGDAICRGEVTSPLRKPRKHTIGQVLAYYKYQTTKIINQINDSPGRRVWQRNYYEHIIRNEKTLNKMREYICNNPLYWASDDENPKRICNSLGNNLCIASSKVGKIGL